MPPFDFGVRGFQPAFVNGVAQLISLHGDLLRSVVGRTLRASWVMWDVSSDVWFPDGPIVMDFDGLRIEACANKLKEFSVTAGRIDLDRRIDWAGLTPDLSLTWKTDADPVLRSRVGDRVERVHVVEAQWRTTVVADRDRPERVGREDDWGWLLHGLEFDFAGGPVTVFNALDENAIESQAFRGPEFRLSAL